MLPLINAQILKDVVDCFAQVTGQNKNELHSLNMPYHTFETSSSYFPSKPAAMVLNTLLNELDKQQLTREFFLLLVKKMVPKHILRFAQAPQNIQQAIEQLIKLSNKETPSAQLQLKQEADGYWLTRKRILLTLDNELPQEIFSLYYFAFFIQHLLQNDWYPQKIKIHSDDNQGIVQSLIKGFNCQLFVGQAFTGIYINDNLLESPVQLGERLFAQQPAMTPPADFIESLEMSLEAYVGEPGFNIKQVAGNLGVSPRTLQYQLQAQNITFKKLKDKVILKNALWMMQHTHLSLTDISTYLGYSSITHFSRAFKRLTGFSPRHYQNQ